MISEYERGWLAGFLDSEGCFSWEGYERRSPTVVVTNTNLVMLERAQRSLGGHINAGTNPGKACFALKIRTEDWSAWLPGMPLIEHEAKRQEFLYWLLKRGCAKA